MSDKTEKLFGTRGEAEKILNMAGKAMPGQAMSKEKLEKVQERLHAAASDHTTEAAAFTEKIIGWLNEEWNEMEFTPEQRIFSIALATVNLRQHFPADRGGKEFFDEVCKKAWEYFDTNKDRP